MLGRPSSLQKLLADAAIPKPCKGEVHAVSCLCEAVLIESMLNPQPPTSDGYCFPFRDLRFQATV